MCKMFSCLKIPLYPNICIQRTGIFSLLLTGYLLDMSRGENRHPLQGFRGHLWTLTFMVWHVCATKKGTYV